MPNIKVVKYRKFWYSVSALVFLLSIGSLAINGLRYGLDFTGGSLLEISFQKNRVDVPALQTIMTEQEVTNARIQPSGEKDYIIRMPELSEQEHQEILKKIQDAALQDDAENKVIENRFESFGSSLGSELKRRSIYAVIIVLIGIIVYLAYAFRKVTHPVSSWTFGSVAVLALIHDVVIIVGLFSLLGVLFGTEIDSFFVTAMLTVLGFSVHDTIVTIDRIRENLFKRQQTSSFEDMVDDSINQTLSRSINTTLTTLFSLTAIYFFGGSSVHDFSLALIAGIIVGTYSSIFLASPLLVTWHRLRTQK